MSSLRFVDIPYCDISQIHLDAYDSALMMDGHLTPEYIDENGLYDNPYGPYGYRGDLDMQPDYEPYARPESHMGFVMDGPMIDEYGQQIDDYGRPINDYGQPINDGYGMYTNGIMEDEYGYYGYGGH
ncbi:hypothetical protein KUTeg_022198 [Tegillarca granosa]|uniref:Uncharacterized protein n=1 Tax=Tegillarca granosa TaxID=220873 RepID=A0ABQ9E5I8_TEGGR|nr:hypothetical protein KUTeg_022198 [Tegillarca granosa]